MKKYLTLAVMVAAFSACLKEQADENQVSPDQQALSIQRQTIVVNMPVPEDGAARTSFASEAAGKMPVVWSAGDRIALIQDKGPSQKVSVYELEGAGGSASGTFSYVSGDASGNDADIKDIIYPASRAADYAIPTSQTYSDGQVDPDANLMAWHDEGGISGSVTLSPVGAVVCVQMTGASFWTVSSVSAKVNGTDYTVSASPAVTFADTTTVKPFYVAVPVTASSQDVEIKVTLGDGKYTQRLAIGQTYTAGSIYRYPACKVVSNGDYFNGEGFVFTSICQSADGRGLAKIVSPDQTTCAFSTENVNNGTTSKHNLDEGRNNTALITNGDSYKADSDTYPGVKWATAHGEGWYLNSSIEISQWYNAFIQNWTKTGHSASNAKGVFTHFSATWFTTGTSAFYQTSCEYKSDVVNKYSVRRMNSDKGANNRAKSVETPVRACKMIVFYTPE